MEKLRGGYEEELKKHPEWEKVELEQAYKQSLLDRLWDRIKQLAKKEEKNE